MNPIPEADALALTENESAFVCTLNADVQLFNETYLEREEDSIIRLRSLEDEGDDAQSPSDLKSVYRCPTPLWANPLELPTAYGPYRCHYRRISVPFTWHVQLEGSTIRAGTFHAHRC